MLINIQTLRFIAASMVVIYHAIPVCNSTSHTGPFDLFRTIGFAGVDIFFVISGYIIWHTTKNIVGYTNLKKFIARRVCRIYSGYVPFYVIAFIILYYFSSRHLAELDILGSLLLIPIGIKERLIPVSWTLTYELFFYISFSFLILIRLTTRLYLITAVFILIALINLIGIGYFDFYSVSFFEHSTLSSRILYSPYNLEFLAGALLSAYTYQLKKVPISIYITLSLLLFAAGGSYNEIVLGREMENGYYIVHRVFFFGIASILLVSFFVLLEERNIRIIPKIGAILGGASYSIYLSHTIIFDAYRHMNIGFEIYPLLYLYLIVLLYSVIHYKYIERPLYKSTTNRLLAFQMIKT